MSSHGEISATAALACRMAAKGVAVIGLEPAAAHLQLVAGQDGQVAKI